MAFGINPAPTPAFKQTEHVIINKPGHKLDGVHGIVATVYPPRPNVISGGWCTDWDFDVDNLDGPNQGWMSNHPASELVHDNG